MMARQTGTSDQQRREHAEPSEQLRPIPLTVAAVALVMVLFGAGYLLLSEPFGIAKLGDRRSVADLSATASGAPGQAGRGAGAADGRLLYTANCIACHQASGQGVPGVFPPLAGSEWVKGDERVLANILLHGISGEITVAGASYKGVMPAFGHLGDADLAAIASYIRAGWSNGAQAITAEQFAGARSANTRTTPFSGGAELGRLAEALAGATNKKE